MPNRPKPDAFVVLCFLILIYKLLITKDRVSAEGVGDWLWNLSLNTTGKLRIDPGAAIGSANEINPIRRIKVARIGCN
jgi:hypothetical protein